MKLALVICMILAAGAASAQPAFPRVDPATQAARDTDRGAILMQERGDEVRTLQAAEKALAAGSPGERDKLALNVERHRKNLAALDAEIQRLGGVTPAPVVAKAAGPVRLKAALAAPAAAPTDTPVPFWDVHRRKESPSQASDAAAPPESAAYWDVFRRKETD